MEITWLGHSCFRVKGKDVTIILDPYDKSIGYPLGRVSSDIVTVSHQHPGHNNVAGVSGNPKVVDGPGEYEIAGVLIVGIKTFHDSDGGKKRGKNTVYLIEMDDLTLCHLGDLGHVPTTEQIEEMSSANILMVPVGGATTLSAAAAAETISLLEPKIVIPMHFKTPALRFELDPVEKFLKEMGLKNVDSQPKLTVTKSNLPDQTQVVLLDYRR